MQKAPRICLLQGPLGPFFAHLALSFKKAGSEVWRCHFNAGDRHFSAHAIDINYHGKAEDWPDFFENLVLSKAIDIIVAYGDMRYYHREAKSISDRLGKMFWSLEEGYIRPGYVTCEKAGNNANSPFPSLFLKAEKDGKLLPTELPEPVDHGPVIQSQIWFGIAYYAVKEAQFAGFEEYRHHRVGGSFLEQRTWIKAGFKKLFHRYVRDRGKTEWLIKYYSGRMILVPLQVAVDSQIVHHSRFKGMADFLEETLASAAKNMNAGDQLIIKHHPMDRGHNTYQDLISHLVRKNRLQGRVHYFFDLDVDALLPHCKSCITINSTLSHSALAKGVPTAVLGQSMVGEVGVAEEGLSSAFWQNPRKVDSKRVSLFLDSLASHSLIPGNFYRVRQRTADMVCTKILA